MGLFLNRFLIPDVSFDSLNYHLYLGFKGWNWQNNIFEFFPTGIHNFSPLLDMVGYGFFSVLGYRLGTVFSVLAIYGGIYLTYKIYKLFEPTKRITDSVVRTFLFVSSFLSFELFLGIATYYVDSLVWCGSLLVVYWLMLYLRNGLNKYLIAMSLMLGVLVLGKMTNIYLAIGAFGVLLVDGWLSHEDRWLKLKRLMVAGGLFLVILLGGNWQNYRLTGNPVFPFYNQIFKSPYYPEENFRENRFGGRGGLEKLGWGISSIWAKERLGEVHDLFHDYKINIYFGLTMLIGPLVIAKRIRDRHYVGLLGLFWLAFGGWSLLFGYLRYGLLLESVGGVLLLIGYGKLDGWKKIFIWPLLLLLVVQNKRVINLSLAYDVSFRPGFYYNRGTYWQNLTAIWTNKIKIKQLPVAEIYLNCVAGAMSYYVVSPFNNLPVLNIDTKAYARMTENGNYRQMSMQKIAELGSGDLNFVTIVAKEGMNTEYDWCLSNLKNRGWTVTGETETDFLGYQPQVLRVIFGKITR